MSANAAFRCSVASAELAEPLAGTASTVRAFLLVECPGPWGVDAVRDSRLPAEVKALLTDLEKHHRVRPLLVRHHGGGPVGSARVFAAYVHTPHPWVETAELDDVRDLLGLDLTGLGSGGSPGLTPYGEPLFLVCTHGKHDACCAERGRPVCAAMHAVSPTHTWEVSHIGGDRFAGNVLVLPQGLYYGRLGPEDAAGLATRHLAGELDLEHLRGRSSYPFSVQAAEVFLRRHTGEHGLNTLELVDHTRQGAETSAVFAVGRQRWSVRVHTELQARRQLTCRAVTGGIGQAHTLVEVAPA